MLPETAVPSFSSGSFQIRLLIWQVAGLLSWTAVPLFVSDTRKPVLRLQEGGANVGQKPCGSLVCFDTGAGRLECWPEVLRTSLLVSDTHAFSLGVLDLEVCPKDSRFDRSFFSARLSNSGPEQNDPAHRKQYQQKAISGNRCYYRFSCKPFQSIHWYSTPGVVVCFYRLRRFDRWAILPSLTQCLWYCA